MVITRHKIRRLINQTQSWCSSTSNGQWCDQLANLCVFAQLIEWINQLIIMHSSPGTLSSLSQWITRKFSWISIFGASRWPSRTGYVSVGNRCQFLIQIWRHWLAWRWLAELHVSLSTAQSCSISIDKSFIRLPE